MKATIESTDAIVDILDTQGRYTTARVWEGVTEKGVPFTAYVTIVQVHKQENAEEFEADLREHKAPTEETQRAIDMRFVV